MASDGYRDSTSSGRRATFMLLLYGSVIAAVIGLCMSAVGRVREAAGKTQANGNLCFIECALRAYHERNGRFPPAAAYDKNGRPLYSWRVLLLPYISQPKLVEEFHLEETWDSPHNLKLLEKMPPPYATLGDRKMQIPPGHTLIQVFVGRGAAFEGRKGLGIPDDFTDNRAATILLVAAGKPVPWTKPNDLVYDPLVPLPDLQGMFDGGFWACMVDGRRHWLKQGTSEATLRTLITRNGGDKPGNDWRED